MKVANVLMASFEFFYCLLRIKPFVPDVPFLYPVKKSGGFLSLSLTLFSLCYVRWALEMFQKFLVNIPEGILSFIYLTRQVVIINC